MSQPKKPFVSVVIPAFNEAVMLPTCLEALRDQDYKGKYEVIVVDNNSTDLTPELAKVYGVRVIKEKKQGVAFARQAGFESARGSIIASTDSDTIAPRNWLTRIVKEFEKDSKLVAVGGACDLINTNTPFKLFLKTIAPFMSLLDKIIDYPGTTSGWNFAVKKEAFEKVGGFNLSLNPNDPGEDRDLGLRLRKIGRVKVNLGLKVKTSARRFMGIFKTFKYFVVGSVYFRIHKKPLKGIFEPIRQRPFESYDVLNDLPFTLPLIILSLISIILIIGAIPSFNIWSTSSVKAEDKIIALTFDTNSNGEIPRQVPDLLKRKNIRATFFINNKAAQKNPTLIKQIYSDGNLVGNLSNGLSSMFKTPSRVVKDANITEAAIYQIIGQKPRFYRPPEGYRTVWGALSLDKEGYEIVTWNSATNELVRNPTSKKIAIDIIKNAKPGGIIDMPDSGSDQTIKATEEIIDLLQADGYKFVTLDALLQKPAYF